MSLSEQVVNICAPNGLRFGRDYNIGKSISEQAVNIWTPIFSRLGRMYTTVKLPVPWRAELI